MGPGGLVCQGTCRRRAAFSRVHLIGEGKFKFDRRRGVWACDWVDGEMGGEWCGCEANRGGLEGTWGGLRRQVKLVWVAMRWDGWFDNEEIVAVLLDVPMGK